MACVCLSGENDIQELYYGKLGMNYLVLLQLVHGSSSGYWVYRRYNKPGSCLGSGIPPDSCKLPPGSDVCRGQFGT